MAPVLTGGLASAAVIPLVVEGKRAGAIFLASRRSRAFLSSHIPLLSALAHQTALAIHNIQLRHQVEHVAVLEERYRLSREMHDGLAQTLSSLGWQVDHLAMLLEDGRLAPLASELTELRHTVREAYLDVREAIDGLRLPVDHPGGLTTALQEYVTDFTSRTGVMATLMSGGEVSPLSPVMALQLLRIVQEALTNVRKHAAAHHARVQLHKDDGALLLSIADDGRGFNPDMPLDHHHLGLASMRERTESLHGQFTLATGPKQGTHITVTVPLIEEEGSGA